MADDLESDLRQVFNLPSAPLLQGPGQSNAPAGFYANNYHAGYDFQTKQNTPIVANANVAVKDLGLQGGYGRVAAVTNLDSGEVYFLSHLSGVSEGTHQPGQVIVNTGGLKGTYGAGASWGQGFSGEHIDIRKQKGVGGKVVNAVTNILNPKPVVAAEPVTTAKKTTTSKPAQAPSIPSNYTGWVGTTPYVGGTVQTSGGGFYIDPNTGKVAYSAGYHGSGGTSDWIDNVDRGEWGTGKNMGPIVNGTVQTGGGSFAYDPVKGTYEYSAGYHGSGEHPEIRGEATPGVYQGGSFGSIYSPDIGNPSKVKDFVDYLWTMGYDVGDYKRSSAPRDALAKQYRDNGNKFDGMAFIKSLSPREGYNTSYKTELLSQVNQNTPYAQIESVLGGQGFSNLFNNNVITPTPVPAKSALAEATDTYNIAQQTPSTAAKATKEVEPLTIQSVSGSNVGGIAGIGGAYNQVDLLKSLFQI